MLYYLISYGYKSANSDTYNFKQFILECGSFPAKNRCEEKAKEDLLKFGKHNTFLGITGFIKINEGDIPKWG
tara:strand:+ start:33 stop:248 length:216 start_codon:yes stop_codon:yes gene_type:complete